MSLIKITKDQEYEYRFSIDGNKYGTDYDCTTSFGFGDEKLLKENYEELLAINGSLFYFYNDPTTRRKDCYACGLEKSRNENNQEVSMSCVSDYNSCMAIACVGDELVFGSQKWIIDNLLDSCYGAITGLGIMLSGKIRKDMHKGFESQWNAKARRTMIGEDKEGNILSYSTNDRITCDDLCEIAIQNNFYNAICLDGGSSVFRRINGLYYDCATVSKVKNALLLYRKKKDVDYKKLYEECLEKCAELKANYLKLKNDTLDFINQCQESTNIILDEFKKELEE